MSKRTSNPESIEFSKVPSVPPEDVDLFATSLYRSRGSAAKSMARLRAKGLLDVGDDEGHRVWNAIADRLTRFGDRDHHSN